MKPEVTASGLAPAKLNLFLHVIGRRADGYHELQSALVLIDLFDEVSITVTDGPIERDQGPPGVAAEDDLTVRAARALKAATGHHQGARISITKRIPLGGGLGGGSSDAATTLILLNKLWQLGLDRERLMAIGLPLGADVPFFVFGRSAFVEGIGERLTPIDVAPRVFALVHPGIHVPTAAVFGAPELTRATKPIKMLDFPAGDLTGFFGHNDLEAVARARFAPVDAAVRWFAPDPARMTGSGACVFSPQPSVSAASELLEGLPAAWKGWVCTSLPRHPLQGWLADRCPEDRIWSSAPS